MPKCLSKTLHNKKYMRLARMQHTFMFEYTLVESQVFVMKSFQNMFRHRLPYFENFLFFLDIFLILLS